MTTSRTFSRLLKYLNVYRVRLAVGIVAGILSGGSLFGVLQFLPGMLEPFERTPTGVVTGDDVASISSDASTTENNDRLASFRALATRHNIPIERADGSPTWQFVLLSVVGIPIFMLLKVVCTYINRYCMRWVGSRVVLDLRDELFASLQRRTLKFYGKCDVGELISRCVNDIAVVEHTVANSVADLTRAPVEIIGVVAAIVVQASGAGLQTPALILFLVIPMCVAPVIILGRRVKKYSRRSMERISELVSRMHENFTGVRVVKAFNMEAAEEDRFRQMNRAYFRQLLKALRAELMMAPMMEFVAIACACFFIIYCYAAAVPLSQITTLGLAAILIYRPAKQLAKINNQIQRATASADRIFDLLDSEECLPEAVEPRTLDTFTDRIVFDHVGFQYDADAPPVVDDICLEIKRGEVVAFVGETGSGKTTLANLLARFYDPTSGRITLDGVDLRDIGTPSLRRLIGIVTQDNILFNDTIATNIAYGSPDASQADIEAAAQQAEAADFIDAEPDGYHRVVGEKGFRLSGGQRQRLAIARAMLRNPQILILDEATGALDTVTEQQVMHSLNRLMTNRTVFAIAHRLSTVQHADRICVLDGGRIVEQGTHAELHAKNGLYRRLCDMQLTGNGDGADV